MQLPTMLGQMVKSGKMTVSTNEGDKLQLKAEDNKIDVNVLDKQFLKEVMQSAAEGGEGKGQSLLGRLSMLRGMAEELKTEGLTITVSYQGDIVITAGSNAKPKLSRIVTGTKAVEINNLRKLMEMGI